VPPVADALKATFSGASPAVGVAVGETTSGATVTVMADELTVAVDPFPSVTVRRAVYVPALA
jgi:hypothetical protein